MSQATKNILIAITSIIALVGLAVLLMYFGELRLFQPQRYEVTINMNIAGGLRDGSPVELNGVPVGVIDRVRLDEREPGRVRAVALINEDKLIPVDVEGRIERGLLGGPAVLLLLAEPLPPEAAVAVLPTDGTAELDVRGRTLFQQIAAELDEHLEGLSGAFQQVELLSATYRRLGEKIEALLDPQQDELGEDEPPNLHTAIVRLNRLLEEASGTLNEARQWLGDEQLQAQVRRTVEDAGAMMESGRDAFKRIAQTTETIERDAEELMRRLMPLSDELSETLAEAQRLLRSAGEGPGTVAELLHNPDLYNSLNDAAVRLERAIDEMQLLMQQLRAEGFRIRLW